MKLEGWLQGGMVLSWQKESVEVSREQNFACSSRLCLGNGQQYSAKAVRDVWHHLKDRYMELGNAGCSVEYTWSLSVSALFESTCCCPPDNFYVCLNLDTE
jgi:hypothetical protein